MRTFLAATLLCAASAFAQAPACPDVTTTAPAMVVAGEELKITVNVKGGDSNVTPTYNWMISAGSITSGQGTSTILVDTTGQASMSITATVEVGGYDPACSTVSSVTTDVDAPEKKEEPAKKNPPR